MNPREIARALAVTTVIADAAAEHKDRLRAELLEALDDVGADAVAVTLPDGTKVAKSALVAPAPRARLTDEDQFAAWCADTSPHNVEVRTVVRPAWQKAILDRVVPGPDGAAVDPDTGEVVPGVTFTTGSAYVSTRFDKEGRAAVLDALRAGTVTLDLTTPTAALPAPTVEVTP